MGATLQTICNVIILIGGVVGAIIGITTFLGKPIKFIGRIIDKKESARRSKIVNDVSNILVDEFTPKFEEIYQQNLEQEETINVLIKSSRDILRKEIVTIYKDHKNERQLSETVKEYLDDLYKDYVSENGNGYVKRIYARMCTWIIVPDDE